ncbi:MAG: DUF4326 domain-containing protein, partial [Actinomycetota bacterium]|nr:DUF4326 domain-containing protein [Actinomycetota bacterium]
MGRVVHVRKDPYDVYVGRGKNSEGTWGNPYRIGDAHLAKPAGEPIARGEAITLHEEWMLLGGGRGLLERHLRELDGLTLGCWCAPEGGVGVHDPLVCHGQNLIRLLHRRNRASLPEEKEARMRFVFSGSRGWRHRGPVRRALAALPEGAVVVTGGARGLDAIAELEA